MSCEHDWTIKFLDVNDYNPFEVRPIEMSLRKSRNEYDFLRATFDRKVGEEMKPHTRYESGALYGLKPVDVCYNDEPQQRLMFRPDWVDYGTENTQIQLHDLHKALADGVIDIQRDTVNLEAIYEEVVNAAANRLIDEIEFTYPNSQVRTIYGDQKAWSQKKFRRQAENDVTKRVVESTYAVDFDNISPERALRRLNKKFRLKSWVNPEGKLIIGLPEHNHIRHIAASNDERVWRYKNPSISHEREPIESVVVWGAWVDEPGIDTDITGWFDKGGTDDVRAIGLAKRKDVDYGTSFSVNSTKAKRDALPHVARLALRERMKQQNAGTVEIDPELSGTDHTTPIDLNPGDLLHLVPDDDYFNNPTATSGVIGDSPDNPDEVCGNFVNNEAYLVTEVEHSITNSGDWQIHADLGMYPDVEIKSSMTYFNPNSGEWVDDDEIIQDGENEGDLKGGIFDIESI